MSAKARVGKIEAVPVLLLCDEAEMLRQIAAARRISPSDLIREHLGRGPIAEQRAPERSRRLRIVRSPPPESAA